MCMCILRVIAGSLSPAAAPKVPRATRARAHGAAAHRGTARHRVARGACPCGAWRVHEAANRDNRERSTKAGM